MPENIEEQKKPAMSKAEMVARLVGPSLSMMKRTLNFGAMPQMSLEERFYTVY